MIYKLWSSPSRWSVI